MFLLYGSGSAGLRSAIEAHDFSVGKVLHGYKNERR